MNRALNIILIAFAALMIWLIFVVAARGDTFTTISGSGVVQFSDISGVPTFQIGSVNLTNWSQVEPGQFQPANANLTNWSAVATNQVLYGNSPVQPGNANLTNWSQVATSQVVYATTKATSISGTGQTLDWNAGEYIATGNTTFTGTANQPASGQAKYLGLTVVGTFTISWPAGWSPHSNSIILTNGLVAFKAVGASNYAAFYQP